MSHRAVIFDLGGVVLGSPLHAIARFERDCGLPSGFINRVVIDTGPEGAWPRIIDAITSHAKKAPTAA